MLSSCSKDESSDNSNSFSISPPSWIIGTWLNESSLLQGFKFTEDDFCQVTLNVENCYKDQIFFSSQFTEQFNNYVNDELSGNTYTIEIVINSSKTTYSFERVSSTKIVQTYGNMNVNLIKQ